MKKIILNTGLLLAITFACEMFYQCKSVDVTLLGVVNSKTLKKTAKSITSEQMRHLRTSEDMPISIKGAITDKANIPIFGADIYMTKSDQIVSFANSNNDGKYSLKALVQPVPINFIRQTGSFSKQMTEIADSTKKIYNDTVTSKGYQIFVMADGFKEDVKKIAVNHLDSIQMNFVLEKLCSVSGVVMLVNKNVVTEANVILIGIDGKLSETKTNQKGEFHIGHLEDGTYSISTSHNKYAFPTQTIELQNGIDKKGIELVANAGEISGNIKVAGANTAIQKAIITLQRIDFSAYKPGQPFQISDTIENLENFKFEGLSGGQYKILVNSPGLGTAIEETELKENLMHKNIDFVLTPEGAISGRLINYDPKDLTVFLVFDAMKRTYSPGKIEIEANGKYKLYGMAPGEYTVILKWKNMLMSKQSIVVQSNKVTPGLNFTLKEISGYISGRIISKSNNEPIENAIIIASSKLSGNYAISDKKGNYKIYGLSPGTYELMVSAQKFENNSKSKLLLENEHVLENIDFYLTNR